MQIRPRRSVLYMPGSNARALEKAKSLAADALILDLEDAVAPEAKETARKQVCEAVQGRRLRPSRARHPHQRARHAVGRGRPGGRRRGRARCRAAAQARHRRRHRAGDARRWPGRCAGQDAAVGDDRDAACHPQPRRHRRRVPAARARGSPASCMGTNDLVKETRADLSDQPAPGALLAVGDRHGRARLRPRRARRRLQQLQGCRRLPPRMRARPPARLRRQDADPPRPGRDRQRGVRAAAATRSRSRARSSPPSTGRRTRARA